MKGEPSNARIWRSDKMIIGIAGTQLGAFALWAGMTQTRPEDYFKKEVRIVRLGRS